MKKTVKIVISGNQTKSNQKSKGTNSQNSANSTVDNKTMSNGNVINKLENDAECSKKDVDANHK